MIHRVNNLYRPFSLYGTENEETMSQTTHLPYPNMYDFTLSKNSKRGGEKVLEDIGHQKKGNRGEREKSQRGKKFKVANDTTETEIETFVNEAGTPPLNFYMSPLRICALKQTHAIALLFS